MDTTNREFFDGLESGIHIQALYESSVDGDLYGKYLINREQQYIWPGRYTSSDGERSHALLVDQASQNIRYVALDKPVQFSRAYADAESYRRTTKYELFLLHCLINANDGHEQQNALIDTLTSEVQEWKADNAALSEILNTWATEQGYEDEFDHEVEGWNKGFSRIHLAARQFEYEARGRLTVTYEVPLKVKAKTSTEADDKLSELDAEHDVFKMISNRRDASEPRYDIEWDTPTRG